MVAIDQPRVSAGNGRESGQFAPKPLLTQAPVEIPDESANNLRNALVAERVVKAFKQMVEDLSPSERAKFMDISKGRVSPEDLVAIAGDDNAPVGLRYAMAHTPHPALVKLGLEDEDWRVQAGALSNVACDPKQVDFMKIDTQAIFAALLVM